MKRLNYNVWSEDDVATLRARYPHESTLKTAQAMGRSWRSVNYKAFKLGLRKTAEYMRTESSCFGAGRQSPETGRFKKGQKAWNAGMKGLDIGSKATRFQKGNASGRARQLYRPIGSERVTVDGYLEIKVNDGESMRERWVQAHRLVWQAAHGPIPPGHFVSFRDGDKTNRALDNLELVTPAQMLARNSVHRLPPELAALCQLKGALQRQINRRLNREK